MRVVYITSNAKKLEAAQAEIDGSGIELVLEKIDVPEVQGFTVEEVGRIKAKYAAELLKQPVVMTDGGFSIKALKGFPGPFTKYTNEWLSALDLIHLMQDKEDRTVELVECLAYCEPGKEPVTFIQSIRGTMATTPGKEGWSPMNQVFIPDGYDTVLTEIPQNELPKFFGLNWGKFKEYLIHNNY